MCGPGDSKAHLQQVALCPLYPLDLSGRPDIVLPCGPLGVLPAPKGLCSLCEGTSPEREPCALFCLHLWDLCLEGQLGVSDRDEENGGLAKRGRGSWAGAVLLCGTRFLPSGCSAWHSLRSPPALGPSVVAGAPGVVLMIRPAGKNKPERKTSRKLCVQLLLGSHRQS